ncbi:hypothetical protein BC826DRAFT_1178975 [Russula brevipes]|nr:hypothetical protein BC826DRAFT_1181703 [Russula brevipes]KAI0285685.1 hypothetical protein BC826DRAFT_1178975 [Russula brevipes]
MVGGKVDWRVVVGVERVREKMGRACGGGGVGGLLRCVPSLFHSGRRRGEWNDEVACTKVVDQGAACTLERATTQDVEGEPPLGGCRGADAEVVGVATVHGRGYTQGRLACMKAADRGGVRHSREGRWESTLGRPTRPEVPGSPRPRARAMLLRAANILYPVSRGALEKGVNTHLHSQAPG